MWLRSIVAVVATALTLTGGLAAHADVAEPAGKLLSGAAVDVNADGLTEVATVHATEQDPTAREHIVDVVLRRGVDGAPLWATTVPTGAITMTPAAVGAEGERGVYLIVRRFNYFVNFQTTEDGASLETPVPLLYASPTSGYDIYAFTAAGTLLWERHVTSGQSAEDPSRTTDQPLELVMLQATPSAADDLLLVTGDSPVVVTQETDGESDIRARIIEGADGSDTAAVTAAEQVAYQAPPVTVGDFDGNGLDDYALQLPDGRIVAHRGADGAHLWETKGDFFGLWPVPDLTGDGISDVFASATGFGWWEAGEAAVLDGRTGVTQVKVVADEAWPTPSGIATATEIESDERVGLELEAYDMRGVVRQTRTLSFPLTGTARVALRRNLGDLNGNGAGEVHYTVTQTVNAVATEHSAVLDGLSLQTLWSDRPAGLSLYASVGGEGDDLLLWEPWGRYAVDITAQRGASGTALWTKRIIPAWDDTTALWAHAADVNGDAHHDVLASIDGERRAAPGEVPGDLIRGTDRVTELHVLDGRDGTLLWKR